MWKLCFLTVETWLRNWYYSTAETLKCLCKTLLILLFKHLKLLLPSSDFRLIFTFFAQIYSNSWSQTGKKKNNKKKKLISSLFLFIIYLLFVCLFVYFNLGVNYLFFMAHVYSFLTFSCKVLHDISSALSEEYLMTQLRTNKITMIWLALTKIKDKMSYTKMWQNVT